MKFFELAIPGCCRIEAFYQEDSRGSFQKTFHAKLFSNAGIPFKPEEEFISVSRQNVLRGMHFQIPPAAHEKLIYCIEGEVLDCFVDLRKGSPTYKRHGNVILSRENRQALFLPKGIAHGFFVKSHQAVMVYKTSSCHDPACDCGILWNSCGIQWPVQNPILSERDRGFPELSDFNSPFHYGY